MITKLHIYIYIVCDTIPVINVIIKPTNRVILRSTFRLAIPKHEYLKHMISNRIKNLTSSLTSSSAWQTETNLVFVLSCKAAHESSREREIKKENRFAMYSFNINMIHRLYRQQKYRSSLWTFVLSETCKQ